jgi:agmatine deiminase
MNRRNFITGMAAAPVLAPAAKAASGKAVQNPPARGAHSFPPEWMPHDAVWMGWTDDVTGSQAHTQLRLDMLAALTPHVAVKMIVDNDAAAALIAGLMAQAGIPADGVSFHVQPTNDVWLRDLGPLFVSDGRTLELAAFAWNNYGFPWPFTTPSAIARGSVDQEIAAHLNLPQRHSDIVAEGGGIDVNSRTLDTYRDAAMHRNPGKTLAEIEEAFKRLYGKEQVIWLDRAPITDRIFAGPKVANFFGWGANGHVDEYVRFVDEDTILVAEVGQTERNRDALMRLDHDILTENRRQLEQARNPDGQPFTVIPVPVPDVGPFLRRRTLTEADFTASDDGRDLRSVYRDFAIGDEIIDVPAVSYLNFLVTNGVILSARYGAEGRPDHLRESDEAFLAILRTHFPDREIAQIDPLAANWDGGGMHCLTQQQPTIEGA